MREVSILTYETVEEIDLEYTRPIIVLGPMKVSNSILRPHYLPNFLGCGGGGKWRDLNLYYWLLALLVG